MLKRQAKYYFILFLTYWLALEPLAAQTAPKLMFPVDLSSSIALAIVTTSPLPTVSEDDALGATQVCISAIGGTLPYTFTKQSGTWPTGISLETNGCLSGTPTTAGTSSNIVVLVTDDDMATDTETFSITVAADTGIAPWICTSVGTSTGTCTGTPPDFTLTGSGLTYGTTDNFKFMYQPTSGDRTLIGNFTACTTDGSLGSEECKLMARQLLDPDAAYASCGFSDANIDTLVEFRQTSGAATGSDVLDGLQTGWARMNIVGGTPDCAVSVDGTSWVSVPIAGAPTLSGTYYVGTALDGNNVGNASATVEDLTLSTYVPPVTGTDSHGYRPHFQGPGYDSTGGYSGEDEICRVNTLTIPGTAGNWPDGGGTGDLRDCFEDAPAGCAQYSGTRAACARYVVFEVSGFLQGSVQDQLVISHPYITIAGGTSPTCAEGSAASEPNDCSDGGGTATGGVTLIDSSLIIYAHDVVIHHFGVKYFPHPGVYMFNIGDSGDPTNSHVHHTIIDHGSFAWADVEALVQSAANASSSIGIYDSLLFEPLYSPSIGGLGMFFFGNNPGCQVTVARTAIIHAYYRVPWVMGPCRYLNVNNVVFNAQDVDLDNPFSAPGLVDSNFFPGGFSSTVILHSANIVGPDSGSPTKSLGFSYKQASIDANAEIYLNGNTGAGITGASGNNQWAGVRFKDYFEYTNVGNEGNTRTDSIPTWTSAFGGIIQYIDNTSNAVRDAVVGTCSGGSYDANGTAGSRPLDRSSDEERVLCDVHQTAPNAGTWFGTWANVVSLYGGLPVLAQRTRSMAASIPMNPGSAGDCGNLLVGGVQVPRTVLQCFLEDDASFGNQRLETIQGTN